MIRDWGKVRETSKLVHFCLAKFNNWGLEESKLALGLIFLYKNELQNFFRPATYFLIGEVRGWD